ncbi:DUF4241 domain-containing protein [Streptomyces sp. NRAIS4]
MRVVEVTEVSPIRVPSGRLVVASPWPDDFDPELPTPAGRELKDRIPPGVHRVQASWTEAPYEYDGEQFDGREEVAVRLLVSDAPVACWEAALGVGESIERIVPGERPTFDSEENMGSFADATAWPSLTEPFRQFWLDRQAGGQAGRIPSHRILGRVVRAGERRGSRSRPRDVPDRRREHRMAGAHGDREHRLDRHDWTGLFP